MTVPLHAAACEHGNDLDWPPCAKCADERDRQSLAEVLGQHHWSGETAETLRAIGKLIGVWDGGR